MSLGVALQIAQDTEFWLNKNNGTNLRWPWPICDDFPPFLNQNTRIYLKLVPWAVPKLLCLCSIGSDALNLKVACIF